MNIQVVNSQRCEHVFAFFFLKEKVTLMNILGIVISVVGVLMIILDGGKLSADVIGILLLLL